MKKLYVLSGVSGSGKSMQAGKLLAEFSSNTGLTIEERLQLPKEDKRGSGSYCSADMFFVGKDGTYNFDPTKLGDAHGACFRECIRAMQAENEIIIVDNTNTTETEIAPYMLAAQAYGYEAEILTLTPGHSMNWVDYYVRCAERNKHGVGFETIKAQHLRIVNRRLPPWWKNTDILPEGL